MSRALSPAYMRGLIMMPRPHRPSAIPKVRTNDGDAVNPERKMKLFGRLILDLIKDGYSVLGVTAPLLSIGVTMSKALDLPLTAGLRHISYAWAFLPLLLWVTIAYARRWLRDRSREATLNDEVAFAFKPVNFHVEQRNDPDSRQAGIRVACIFRNFSAKAVKYKLASVVLNDVSQAELVGLEDVVPPNSDIHFWTSFAILDDWTVGKNRIVPLNWQIEYGSATGGLPSRRMARSMRLEIIDAENVAVLGDKESDTYIGD